MPPAVPATLYVDTSALLKRFVAEAGSDVVEEILTDSHFRGRLYIAAHTEPELISGLNEKYRQGNLAHRDVQSSIARFKRLEAIFAVVGLGPPVVAEASLVLNRHRTANIRGADALHLARRSPPSWLQEQRTCTWTLPSTMFSRSAGEVAATRDP